MSPGGVLAIVDGPRDGGDELLAAARGFADDLGETLSVLFVGEALSDAAERAGAHGVDRAIVVGTPAGGSPTSPWVLDAALGAVERVAPRVILTRHAGDGRELGPSIAYRLDAAVVTDCVHLALDDGGVVATKPIHGGNVFAEFVFTCGIAVITLRPGSIRTPKRASRTDVVVEQLASPCGDDRVKLLEDVVEATEGGPGLRDAEIVVAGGRGIGGPENWRQLDELAAILGAAVGASRAATDAGWVPHSVQIGLTGATIAPHLYIAVGISGAVHHLAGVGNAGTIVAINSDPDANIWQHARFGVVGDWRTILPAFTERVRELRVNGAVR